MPVDHEDEAARRSVVPESAGRSLWLAAAWTGVGAAVVCATLAIGTVAVCWLPVSGPSGHSSSAIHAGLLSFLAALHGGITVDGMAAAFLPLGMMIIVGAVAWRSGSGLADVANALGETDPARLCLAGVAQAASFTLACLVAVPFARLGTSSAPLIAVGACSFVVFTVTGGAAFVRSSALADAIAGPSAALAPVLRAASCGVAVYLGVGAVLVAGSLLDHAGRVETLSSEVGGGWGSIPILLLGVLAVPNAVVAGAAYLAGPGFVVGAGSTTSAVSTTHGLLPAFPMLGALPQGHGASGLVWMLVVLTPLGAGLAVARLAARADGLATRLRDAGAAALTAGGVMSLLAWQAGGSIGAGHLQTVGASPWRVGVFVAMEVAGVAAAALGIHAAAERIRATRTQDHPAPLSWTPGLSMVTGDQLDGAGARTDDGAGDRAEAAKLAG